MNDTNVGMSSKDCLASLDELGISPSEAAEFFGISERTFRRYLDGDTGAAGEDLPVPGPVAQALRGWRQLNKNGLPWRPDESALAAADDAAVARHRIHNFELSELLRRVRARGGPTLPWVVDLDAGKASLGAMVLSFYRLQDGGFSPQSYTRRDMQPDVRRDWPMLEEGFACIARALGTVEALPMPALGNAGCYQGRFILWEDCPFPTFVVLIDDDVARKAAHLDSAAPLSEVLNFLNSKRRALARCAVGLIAEEKGHVNNLGARELVLDEQLLARALIRRRPVRPVLGNIE